MANYVQTTFFAPKDALLSGNPQKLIKGSDVDPELAAIATAIATKYDSINAGPAAPSAVVGLTAVTGSAATWMSSDSAPALNQAIVPTWTGNHTFSAAILVGAATGSFQGAGSINAQALYINGVAVTAGGSLIGSNNTWTGLNSFAQGLYTSGGVPVGIASNAALGFSGGNTFLQSFGPNNSTLGALNISAYNANTSSAKIILAATISGLALSTISVGNTTDSPAIALNGPVTIPAPPSGSSLTVATLGGVGINITSPANQTAALAFTQAGQTQAYLYNPPGTNDLRLQVAGTDLFLAANSGPALKGYGPVAAALVDMTPDKGTFTGTLTGMTGSVTGTCVWSRNGNQAQLFIPIMTGTSNAGTLTMTGLPAAIQPARALVVQVPDFAMTSGGSIVSGIIAALAPASGTITFLVNAGSTLWISSNTKGVSAALVITYLLN